MNAYISAVKQLIAVNHIQNNIFVYIINVCVLCLFIMCMYKYTHLYVKYENIYMIIFLYYI